MAPDEAVGADGLTNAQWAASSRPGAAYGMANEYRKQNSDEERERDRKRFEETPAPKKNPRNKNQIRPARNIDAQGNFFVKAATFDELAHGSVIGADVVVLEGEAVEALKNDVHEFNDSDDVDFYRKLVDRFIASGKSYYTGQLTVRYGPVSRLDATFTSSTWLMRNGQLKYWVTRNLDGTFKVEARAYDYFNVTPQPEKGGVYNRIANILNPLHKMSGGNPNMQTRAQWEVIVKLK